MNQTIRKIENILTSQYSDTNYTDLVREIFPSVKIIAPDRFMKEYTNFSSHIEGYTHVGNYTDPDGKNLIIHAVRLKKESYVENSRSTQRSYAKKLIEAGNADAAIVAFYTKDDPKWRLSFVRLDYEIKFENGKLNTTENMTPAKRYSYLVGKDEPCHTAISRFNRFITDDPNVAQPTLDDLEEAFSVEKVTQEFFQLYCEKFHQLRESLEANDDFVTEAQEHNFTSAQFAKKLMGQIVFLYFLQKKGWMGVGAWTSPLTKKQYDNVFFTQGAKGRVIKEYLPKVYVQTGVDEYKLNVRALDEIPDDAEEIIANHLPSRKNWGSGSKQFMRGLFNVSQKKGGNFFDDYLEPLFYDALNVNRGEQGYDPTLHCRIPFLSGGLFEPIDGYDWKHNDFAIPNEIFSNRKDESDRDADGILDIFDRYNFTMSEDEPLEREVAIDPEMLGKVFENLLEVQDRKSKGAFYTPREIVHYMCQETLISYLIKETGLKEQDIRDFILLGDFLKDEDTVKERRQGEHDMFISEDIYKIDKDGSVVVDRLSDIDNALANIRVVDPAVGSGAFPLGMLNEIVRARQNISAYMAITMNPYEIRMMYNNERSPYTLKLETIKNCLFAADIEPSAVDIAQLRLWLSLVIDDEINPEAQSLLDGHRNPLPLPNLECNIVCGNSLIDEFEGIKLVNFSDALGTSEREQQRNLFQSAYDAVLPSLLAAQDALFYCDDTSKKQQLKEQIEALKEEIVNSQMHMIANDTRERYQKAIREASKPFVLWQIDFARVFKEKSGFDIVIGNPPYGAKFTVKEKKVLSRLYEGCCVPDYESADFFIELGRRLTKEQGTLSYIVPNMFMANVFAEKYRHHLLDSWSMNKIDNLSEIDVFDSAAVRNCIVFFSKDERSQDTLFTKLTIENGNVKAKKAKFFSDSTLIEHIDNWLNLIEKDEVALAITYKISAGAKPLSEYASISQGLIPYDKYRGHTPEQIKNKVWNADYKKDESYRKELRGKDVERYSLTWNGKDWISYGEWLAAPRRPEFFKEPRILVREITNPRILATFTDEEYYNTPSIINCIEFQVDIFFVLGVVNSELMSFYHNMVSPKASKGLFPKILVNDVRSIPINTSDQVIIERISDNVKQMLTNDNYSKSIDETIDELVYQLYDISSEEQNYIRQWFEQKCK